jgi:tetratricopeptide (TPR) repeat protein
MGKADVQQLTPAVAFALREAMALLQRGSLAAARVRAEAALEQFPGHGAIHAFLGALCCKAGDTAAGIPHLRAALETNADDVTIAVNLTAALIETGAFEDAALVCSDARADRDPSHRLWRLRGYIQQQRGDPDGAMRAYERVVAHAPDDSESWNNLGNARAAVGRQAEAILALEQAARLRPDSAPIRLNLAATLSQEGRLEDAVAVLEHFTRAHPDDPKPLVELTALLRHLYRDAEALDVLERAVAASPGDAGIRVQLGEEWGAAFDFDRAERAFRDALAIEPGHSGAYIQLALLLEHTNREAELPALLRAAETAGASGAAVQFIQVLICRREQAFARGLAILHDMPADIEPIRRAQLEGQFRDRLDDADGAFAAFSEMNRLFKLDPSEPLRRGEATRARLRGERALITREWYRGWEAASPVPTRPAPVFLVGFPRSGTTLLDTMLMGHPDVQVLEERPPLRQVEERLGSLDRLPQLGADGIAALRDHYFTQVAQCVDLRSDALLIDKSPLHMNKVPLIHRLFPEARFILALRHPYDVVLSCFMTSFRLNDAMASFLDLETAAEFYDLSFGHWTNCTSIMPVAVHPLRYEKMVEDPESALRELLKSLDLEWRPSVMDYRKTARVRGTISSASYSQVTESLYQRASGRWERYRSHLKPTFPVLASWVEHFGY